MSESVSECNDYHSLEGARGANYRNVVYANYTSHSEQYLADFYYSIIIIRISNGVDMFHSK